MAQHNEILEGSLNQVLLSRLAMQGTAPVPALMPEMNAAIVLENDRSEWGYIKRELHSSGWGVQAALAANYSIIRLNNPPSSNVLAVVTLIAVQNAQQTRVLLIPRSVAAGVGVPNLPTPQFSAPTDARVFVLAPTQRTTLALSAGTSAAFYPSSSQLMRLPANGRSEVEIVLCPGSAIDMTGETLNSQQEVLVAWRERRAEPGELG